MNARKAQRGTPWPGPKLLTTHQVAEILSCTPQQLYRPAVWCGMEREGVEVFEGLPGRGRRFGAESLHRWILTKRI